MLPIASYSQITGGGSGNNNDNNQSAAPNKKGVWKHRFNVNIGLNKPLGTWQELPVASATLSDAYLQNTGFGVTRGFSIELGNVFYLKQINFLLFLLASEPKLALHKE